MQGMKASVIFGGVTERLYFLKTSFSNLSSVYYSTDDATAIFYSCVALSKHGLNIPYVDIHFDKDALVGVTLSPTLKPDDERDKILAITRSNGYTGVTANSVVASEIPVRF